MNLIMVDSKRELKLLSWNCRGVYSCIPYLSDSLRSLDIDICALSEHWLRTFQLHVLDSIDNNYVSIAKGSDEANPEVFSTNNRSGVALIVSKNIYPFVSIIDVDSDRIVGIELNLPGSGSYFIFSIYLPAATQSYEYFKNQIELLFELISVFEEIGSVIVMGDFNVKINGPRLTVVDNTRTKLCRSLMEEHDLFSVNMELFCSGPIETFQSFDGGPSSSIDHILMNTGLRDSVNRAAVLNNQQFSLSDHHPVLCILNLDSELSIPHTSTSKPSVSWEKAFTSDKITDYTFAVSQNLWSVAFPKKVNKVIIDSYYVQITSAIRKAEIETLPYKTFKRHIKPYWNEDLSVFRDFMRSSRIEWINNCHCYNDNCVVFNNYKKAKKLFRDSLRKAVDEYESKLAKQIEDEVDVDQKAIWSILNRRKTKPSSCCALKKGDDVFTDANDISEIWYEHFQHVFAPSTYTDQDREHEIMERVSSIRAIAKQELNNVCIDFSCVYDIISHLKRNKACGHDGISYEHIKYGGKLLIKHLTHLFNMVLQEAYIPNDWRRSIIILLYKREGKPKNDTNSYRGISLVPCITKIFEKILDILLTSLRHDFPNVQQVAYQKMLSSLNASFNLQELTFHHIERNGTIIIILLDSTKAFDTVPHDGLRIKLHEYGAKGKLWLLLDNMYNDLSSAVLCNGVLSKWFKLNRGVRQGSALSAKLYLIFINDLIDQLEKCNKGASMHDLTNVSSPVLADDISLVATSRESAQEMVLICENYSKAWSFSFSAGKSKFLQFGKRTLGQNIVLYNEPILPVSCAKHVGIMLDTSLKTMDRTLKACRTIRSTAASVIRIGIHPAALNPIVCAKIIRQVCYPKALYGCELWGKLSDTETLMLERTHRYVCKFIQNLPRLTRTDMCLSLIGWNTIDAYICEKKLLFFGRICNLPQTAISLRILVRRLFSLQYTMYANRTLGFTSDCVNILQKYNLTNFLDVFLANGPFPPIQIWKRIVRNEIQTKELADWNQRLCDDNDFRCFRQIHKTLQPHPAWTVALNNPHLRKHAHYVVSLCCLINDKDSTILCEKCGKMFKDPCIHAITSCDHLSDIRDEFWTEIISINPIMFSVFLGAKNDDELCFTLLSCQTDFDLDDENMNIFQTLCVSYVYKLCKTFNR